LAQTSKIPVDLQTLGTTSFRVELSCKDVPRSQAGAKFDVAIVGDGKDSVWIFRLSIIGVDKVHKLPVTQTLKG